MAADDLGNVVAKGDGGIRIQRTFGNIAGIFGEVILGIDEADPWNFGSIKAVAVVVEAEVTEGTAPLRVRSGSSKCDPSCSWRQTR